MNPVLIVLMAILLSAGCNKAPSTPISTPEFELREFVVKEEKTAATEYSKAWNSFMGTGTLMARNIDSDRNMLVWLEARDKEAGPNSEPKITAVLLRGGLGKVELEKSKYGETSVRPDYQWNVLGWQELNKATIHVGDLQTQ